MALVLSKTSGLDSTDWSTFVGKVAPPGLVAKPSEPQLEVGSRERPEICECSSEMHRRMWETRESNRG